MASKEEDIPLVTMHFRRKDRPPLSLTICAGDEPLQLAVTFAAEHALPSNCIPKLKEQIIFHKDAALANLSLNNLENEEVSIIEQQYSHSIPITTPQQSQQLDVSVDEEKAYGVLREKWSSPNNHILDRDLCEFSVDINATHTEKKKPTRSNTPSSQTSRQRSLSAPPKLSSDRSSDRQQLIYDRLYSEGQLSKDRIEKLRAKILTERSQLIRSSSFREILKRKSGERKRTNRRSNSAPRTLPSTSFFKSSADVPPLPNQHVFDKLYNSSHYSRLRLNSLKERLEREEQIAIERSSFRKQLQKKSTESRYLNQSIRQGNNFHEKLYNHDIEWIKQREKGLEQIRKKLEIEKEESIARELTLRPMLSTSTAMQPTQRSKTGEDISETLYKYDQIYKENRKRLCEKREMEIAAKSYLIPKIPESSKKILSHRKNQLSMSTITMSVNDLNDLLLSDGEDDVDCAVGTGAGGSKDTSPERNVTTFNVEQMQNLFDGYVALSPSRTGQTIVFTVNSPMHAAAAPTTTVMHPALGNGDDDHCSDENEFSIQDKEIFTPDESSLRDEGFNEEKCEPLSKASDENGFKDVENQCQTTHLTELNNSVDLRPKGTEFIKHCMAGVLMRRPTLTENKPNSKSFLRVNSEQVTSAGDESSISGTTNSAIRRFDEVLMTEIRSGPQMPLQILLNVRSSADAETDDRSSGQNRLLIERTRDSVSKGRPRSTSPTVIPRSSRSNVSPPSSISHRVGGKSPSKHTSKDMLNATHSLERSRSPANLTHRSNKSGIKAPSTTNPNPNPNSDPKPNNSFAISRRKNTSLFDRLHEARSEMDEARKRKQAELDREFTFSPNINSSRRARSRSGSPSVCNSRSRSRSVDRSRGRSADSRATDPLSSWSVFDSLHSLHAAQLKDLQDKQKAAQNQAIQEASMTAGNGKQCSIEEQLKTADRLIYSRFLSEIKTKEMQQQLSEDCKTSSSMRFVTAKSENLVFQTHRDALNEIFDILLCTAKLNTAKKEGRSRHQQPHHHHRSGSGSSSSRGHAKRSENKSIGNIVDKDLQLIAGILYENSFTDPYKHSSSMDSPPSRKSNQPFSSPYHKTKLVLEELISQTSSSNFGSNNKYSSNNHNSNKNKINNNSHSEKSSNIFSSRRGAEHAAGIRNGGDDDDDDGLIIAAAIPQVLQPKILADTIGAILTESSCCAATISREEFITKVQKKMRSGSIPVIGYLLSQPSVKEKSKRIRGVSPHEIVSSVEREVRLHCTGKPDLVAREVTERLVKDRYKLRIEKKQSIEDSMMQYLEVKSQRAEERKKRFDMEAAKECTFSPNTASPYRNPYRENRNREESSSSHLFSNDAFSVSGGFVSVVSSLTSSAAGEKN